MTLNRIHQKIPFKKYVVPALYFLLGVVFIEVLIAVPQTSWNNRDICMTAAEIKIMSDDPTTGEGPKFTKTYAAQNLNSDAGCIQSNKDRDTIVNIVGTEIILISMYILLVAAINDIAKRVSKSNKVYRSQYAKLEKRSLWRFSKVLYWTATFAIILWLIYMREGSLYPLRIAGLVLLVLSFPLYLAYRRLMLYIFVGNKQ